MNKPTPAQIETARIAMAWYDQKVAPSRPALEYIIAQALADEAERAAEAMRDAAASYMEEYDITHPHWEPHSFRAFPLPGKEE